MAASVAATANSNAGTPNTPADPSMEVLSHTLARRWQIWVGALLALFCCDRADGRMGGRADRSWKGLLDNAVHERHNSWSLALPCMRTQENVKRPRGAGQAGVANPKPFEGTYPLLIEALTNRQLDLPTNQ
jgi:hypothetical protein